MKVKKMYDIGKELFSTPAYPGDPVPGKTPYYEIEKGDACNLTVLTMGSHNGTHLDAPKHFCAGKHGVDRIPWKNVWEPAKLQTLQVQYRQKIWSGCLRTARKSCF
ncbi:MAG: cyclase family protein [Blautia marasmi]